jgi:hypothetical protein
MNSAARPLAKILTLGAILGCFAPQAFSQTQYASGDKATLTVKFTYKNDVYSNGEFKDHTTIDQIATIVCPITASGPETISSILGATDQQVAANKKLGDAATKEVNAIAPDTISAMKDLDKQMKACKASGVSAQICGLQVMAAMQSNSQLMNQMGAMGKADQQGMADAQRAVEEAADSYLAWYNEGCTGTMTVNNSFQLDDPTIPGPEPILRTVGTRSFNTRETLVTVETDLKRNETRYMILAPQEKFQRDAYPNEKPSNETLTAIPVNPVIAGPFPGPIQAGRYGKTLATGAYAVEWSFSLAK